MTAKDWVVKGFIFVFSLTAVILSGVSAQSCTFLKQTILTENGDLVVFKFGIWKYLYTQPNGGIATCLSTSLLNDDFIEPELKASRAFSTLAILSGVFGLILLLMPLFMKISKCTWKSFAAFPFVSILFQGLSFIIFALEDCGRNQSLGSVECSFDDGAGQAVAAMVLYLFSGILITLSPTIATPPFPLKCDCGSESSPQATDEENAK